MKKLYTLLAAATFATSAFALQPIVSADYSETTISLQKHLNRVHGKIDSNYINLESVSATSTVRNAPAAGWTKVGDGTFRAGLLGELVGVDGEEWTVALEESTANNEHWYRFIPYGEGTPVSQNITNQPEYPDNTYMYINATDPKKVYVEDFGPYGGLMTFGQLVPESPVAIQYVIYVNKVEYQEDITEEDAKTILTRVSAYGTMEDGVITFPQGNFVSLVPKDLVGLKQDTWAPFNNSGLLGVAMPGKKLPLEWLNAGTADFSDGIVGAMFGGELVEGKYILQEHAQYENVYRIYNAWVDFGSREGLIFNTTYPECVQIPYQSTGIMDQSEGETYIIGMTSNVPEGTTVQDVLNDEKMKPYIMTMEGNVISIPGNAVLFNWPSGPNADKLYTAKNPLAAKIVMNLENSSIEEVAVEDENAPVEYYNLQGVRVDNPENGLYIRRQGNKATKVLVK